MAKLIESIPQHARVSFIAGEDLTGKEGLQVTCDGASADGEVLLADALTEEVIGTLEQGGASGSAVTVIVPAPIVIVTAGGTVTRGKRVKVDVSDEGKLVNIAGGSAALYASPGIAITSAEDGQAFSMLQAPASNYYAS